MSYMNKTSMLDEMLDEMSQDISRDEPDITLQCLERGVWRNVMVDDNPVKSPIDFNSLPAGKYRLV